MPTQFERPPTAQAAVLTELRRRIVEGELAPGQPIRQEALAKELGVSRLPVREALMVLQAEHLVEYTQHKGYVASSLDLRDLTQTYHLRGLLEDEAVRQAVGNLTDEHIAQMRRSMDEMESAPPSDVTRLLQGNREFHFLLFSVADNSRLDALVRQLWDLCDRYRILYYTQPADLERVLREHREIVDAAEARDTELLIELLRQHREGGLSAMQSVFAERELTSTTS